MFISDFTVTTLRDKNYSSNISCYTNKGSLVRYTGSTN